MLKTRPTRSFTDQACNRKVGKGGRVLVLLSLMTLFLLGGIVPRLGYLQIVEGNRNRQMADENRIRLIPKPPERGKILDRKGRILAGNKFSYSVFLWPLAAKKPEWPQTARILSRVLNIPAAEIEARVKQAGVNSPSLIRIAQGITQAQIVALEEHRNF